MALKVLLADESSTIKKALQMALAEYGIDVKMVPSGLDVLTVAESYQPHIVLADVLLTQKSGYDVCAELKSNPRTSQIPVVLMWSSFIQLDQKDYNRSKADASLEKPFDTETVQNVFVKLLPHLNNFPLKGFINHPALPDFEESDTFVRQKTSFNLEKMNTPEPPVEEPTIPDIPDIPSSAVTAPPTKPSENTNTSANAADADSWSAQRTNEIQIETLNYGEFEEVMSVNSSTSDIETKSKINSAVENYLKDSLVATHKAQTYGQQNKMSAFDEQLIKEEIRQTAEKICWQIIPEITEKIVREELKKLLQDIETNI